MPQRTNADCIPLDYNTRRNTSSLPQRTNADCILCLFSSLWFTCALPQRTNADCIRWYSRCGLLQAYFASAHKCGLHRVLIDNRRVSITFASAHKCGLHPVRNPARNQCYHLCLSAQMRIASKDFGISFKITHLCLSAQMRIASACPLPH